jgi:hypothetical protein
MSRTSGLRRAAPVQLGRAGSARSHIAHELGHILLTTGNETKAEKMGQALLKEAHDSLTATVR